MKMLLVAALVALFAVCERPPSGDPDHSAHDHTNANVNAKTTGPAGRGSSPGAESAPKELQFIDTMNAQIETAIELALLVNNRSRRTELRDLAKQMLSARRSEAARLREHRKQWFDGARTAVNLELPGIRTSLDSVDAGKLELLKANEFDVEFLRQMIAIGEGAIEAAGSQGPDEKYGELKVLFEEIVKSHTAEAEKMRGLLTSWSVPK